MSDLDRIPSTWAGQQGVKLYQAVQVFLRRLGLLVTGNGTTTGESGQNWPNVVQPAWGGMRYRTDTPVTRDIGTAYTQITEFNEQVPPQTLHVTYDSGTDEIVIAADQGGFYFVSLLIDFEGNTGRTYFFRFFVDTGSGPQPVGDEIHVTLGGSGVNGEISVAGAFRANGGWRTSLWVRAELANSDFEPRLIRLDTFRITPRLPDNHGSEVDFGRF